MKLQFLDLYCGGGGTSTGIKQACAELGFDYRLMGLNHWDKAIETHNLNNLGEAREANIYITNPNWAVPAGRLDLLCASPECIYHSIARAGRGPCNEQSRSAAFDLFRWIDSLNVDWLMVENVKEFVKWGPLNKEGSPDKSREGIYFNEWLAGLKERGYKFEYKFLNSADYGAYTARTRFFLIATKTKKPIAWPDKSFADNWNAARDIIDWSVEGKSVFTEKSLVRNSMKRICLGLKKFNGIELDIDYAMDCVKNKRLPVVRYKRDVTSFFTKYNGGAVPRAHSIDEPIRTIDTSNRFALLTPFLYPQQRGFRNENVRNINRPMPTIAAAGCEGLIEPFLTKYYGTGGAVSVDDPLGTVTTKDRFSLAEPSIMRMELDIKHRMMEPHELSRAMGFPEDYKFAGGRTATKRMIGNAVEVNIARELVKTILKQQTGDNNEHKIHNKVGGRSCAQMAC